MRAMRTKRNSETGEYTYKPVIINLFDAIGHFFCKIGLHNWKFSHDTGINEYYECKRCKKRKVEYYMLDGYQPIDKVWLNDPIIKKITKSDISLPSGYICPNCKKEHEKYEDALGCCYV